MPDHFPDNQELTRISKSGTPRTLKKGEVLAAKNASLEHLYYILQGSLEVVASPQNRRHPLAVLSRGDWIGLETELQPVAYPFNIIAAEDSKVLELDRSSIQSMEPKLRERLLSFTREHGIGRLFFLLNSQDQLLGKYARVLDDSLQARRNIRSLYSDSSLIQSVIANIPRLPMYAGEIVQRIHDPSSSAKDVAGVIREDPSLASQVLKYVNSPYYGFHQKVVDLEHAIMLLGFNQIHQLVIYNSMRSTMPHEPGFKKIQLHSIVVSFLAAEVAAELDPKNIPLISTLGIIHDVGKSIILLLQSTYPKLSILFQTMDHPMLGGMLLSHWKLPPSLAELLQFQHYYRFAPLSEVPGEHQRHVALLAWAHLVMRFLQGEDAPARKYPFISEYAAFLGLETAQLPAWTIKNIIPRLLNNKKVLPASVRSFLERSPRRSQWEKPG